MLSNILAPRTKTVDTGVTRWAIFTDPEIAQVGLTKGAALARGLDTRLPMAWVDRATVAGASEGFIETVHSRTGKLHGVTIVGPRAAEWANQWIEPITSNRRLAELAFRPHDLSDDGIVERSRRLRVGRCRPAARCARPDRPPGRPGAHVDRPESVKEWATGTVPTS